MYGIINQSIQDLVVKEFGEETWLKIIAKSKIDVHEFQNHQVYDDAYTYRMDGDAMLVEYHSKRPGLTAMMEGMLHGIVKMFKEQDVQVLLESEKINSNLDHDLFRITWEK
jgi:hypothetical protein